MVNLEEAIGKQKDKRVETSMNLAGVLWFYLGYLFGKLVFLITAIGTFFIPQSIGQNNFR